MKRLYYFELDGHWWDGIKWHKKIPLSTSCSSLKFCENRKLALEEFDYYTSLGMDCALICEIGSGENRKAKIWEAKKQNYFGINKPEDL